jgi:hypothetical protein
MSKIDVEVAPRLDGQGPRALLEGEQELFHEAAAAARDVLGDRYIAVAVCVVREEDTGGLSTAMYLTFPARAEPMSPLLRDLIADTVAVWDRRQKADRD